MTRKINKSESRMALGHDLGSPLRPRVGSLLQRSNCICGNPWSGHPSKWKRCLSFTCLVHDFLHGASGDDRSPALARHPNTNVKHLIAAIQKGEEMAARSLFSVVLLLTSLRAFTQIVPDLANPVRFPVDTSTNASTAPVILSVND